MSKVSKAIVTIVIIVIFVFLYAIIFGVRSEAGRPPGILGLVLFAGMIGAIRAVWKKDKKEDEDNLPDKQ